MGAVSAITDAAATSLFTLSLEQACADVGRVSSVLLIPPDSTRFHSRAGFFTGIAWRVLSEKGIAVTILPALGTHVPLSAAERERMFPGVPESRFRIHDWRNDVAEIARIEREWVEHVTCGAVSYDWPVQVNKMLQSGGFDLIVSLGQVVPHEVIGMANHAKNLFVGTGGKEAIDKSHFAGAVYGMERIMGRTDTPVRALFDEGFRRSEGKIPPVFFALTVVSADLCLRGLFCGFGRACFEQAAALSRQLNVDLLDEPVRKAVVYLDPAEFRTTWLGNKAVYRTRMAMASPSGEGAQGELVIIAPGLERFGEDAGIDALIRQYGYRPAAVIREKVAAHAELANNLSAAAHLIHGSSEGRFTVRYCPGPGLSRQEIESVGFAWGDITEAMARYDIRRLAAGWNTGADGSSSGEDGRFFYVPNPALGLWALRSNFTE